MRVDQKVDQECGAADLILRAAELFAAQRDVDGDQTLDRQQANEERILFVYYTFILYLYMCII